LIKLGFESIVGITNLGNTIFLNEYINNKNEKISRPGTKGPRKTETEGATTAITEVEQHTAEVANAEAVAERDDTPVDAPAETFILFSSILSSTIVQIFGRVKSAAYKRPERIEITRSEIPGS
jgi:hypothetical protein